MKNRFNSVSPACIIFLYLLIGVSITGATQNPQEFLSITYSALPQADFKDMQGKAGLQNLEFNLITPTIKAGKKTTFNNAVNYQLARYSFENLHFGWRNLPKTFHDIRYSIIVRHSFNKNWSLLALPRINIRSDFKGKLSMDDVFPGIAAVGLYTSTRNSNLRYGLGVTYNRDIREHTILPLVALMFASPKMRVNILLPSYANIVFTPSAKLEPGFAFNISPAIYHTNVPIINGQQTKYIRTFNVFIAPTLSYNLGGMFWLNARAGYALFRRYEVWNEHYKPKADFMENGLKAAPFGSLGIGLRVKDPAK